MATEKQVERAVKALENMKLIVNNEALVRGEYATCEVVNEKLAKEGAICQGHKFCAIGSLWTAYGVKMVGPKYEKELPGSDQSYRSEFLENRPALGIALDALNKAADKFIADNGLHEHVDGTFDDSIEALFEGTADDDENFLLNDYDLVDIIDEAIGTVQEKSVALAV